MEVRQHGANMTIHFSASDLIAHRSKLLQALEELKYKRTECQDLHSRIEKLFAENLEVQQNIEDLQSKLKNSDQRQEHLREELKVASANAGKGKLVEENQGLKEAVGNAERTIASLKKELSMNSLARHHLEISLKQAEQKAVARETSSKAVIDRLRSIEVTTEKLSKLIRESDDAQTLLHKNVEASKRMNRELVRTCAHTNCVINECKRERDQLKEKLFQQESKYRLLSENGSSNEQEQILQNEVQALQRKMEHMEAENASKTKFIGELQTKVKEAQLAASKAHKIVKLSTSDDKNVIDLEKRLESAENKRSDLEKNMIEISSQLKKMSRVKEAEIAELKANFNARTTELTKEIEALKFQLNNARIKEADCDAENKKHEETYLSLKEIETRMASVQDENCSLQDEVKEKRYRCEKLQSEVESLHKIIASPQKKQSPNCTEQLVQTGIEVASLQAGETSHERDSPSQTGLSSTIKTQGEAQNWLKSTAVQQRIHVEGEASEHAESSAVDNTSLESGDKKSPTEPEVENLASSKGNNLVEKAYASCIAEHTLHSGPRVTNLPTNDAAGKLPGNLCEEIDGRKNLSDLQIPDACNEISMKTFQVSCSRSDMQAEKDSQKNSLSDSLGLNGNIPRKEMKNVTDENPDPARQNSEVSHRMEDHNLSCRKHHPFVKNTTSANLLVSSPVLSGPTASTVCEQYGFRKSLAKKRKLSSTPPMLDASQYSVTDEDPASDPVCKQVPLRVPKNFSKQVISNKPHRNRPQPANRFKPLDMLSETTAPRPSTNTSRPYTDVNQFSKTYASLKDRLASKCAYDHRMSHGVGAGRIASESSGTMSLGFQLAADDASVPASDEDDAALEVLNSDDSM